MQISTATSLVNQVDDSWAMFAIRLGKKPIIIICIYFDLLAVSIVMGL